MRERKIVRKWLSFGIVLVLVAVVFAVMPVPVGADGGAEPSSTWTIEPGFRLDGGWPHCPDIVRLPDGTYRMYYGDASPYSGSYPIVIRSAVSSNGQIWTRESGIRIGLGYGGQGGWASTPETIILPDGTYRMYYLEEQWPFGHPSWGRISSAMSTDGLTWTKEAGIRIDYGGMYDSQMAICPNIIELPDGTYRMYYAGYDGEHYRIQSAVSTDGLTWTKEDGVRIDIGGSYDNHDANFPRVIQVPDGRYIMFYRGSDELWNGQILSAVSMDGLIWTKENGIRISPEGLEGSPYSYVSPGDIIKLSDSQYRMYFHADRHPKTGVTPDQWKNRFRILSAVGTIPLISPRNLKEDAITDLENAKIDDHLTICPEGMVGYWKFDEISTGGTGEEVSYEADTSYSYPPQWIDATPINKIYHTKIEWWIRSHSTDPNYQAYFWAAEISDSSGVIYSNTNQLTTRDTINYVLAAKYEPGGTFDVTEVKSKWYGNNWHTMDARVIVHYSIPDVVVDSSGNGNDGIIHGASWTPGQVDGALKFDGVDDYVKIPNINVQEVTLETWAFLETLPITTARPIISKWYIGEGGQWILSVLPNGKIRLDWGSGGSGMATYSSGSISVNTWHYYAATLDYDGIKTTGKVYLDGTLVGSNTYNGAPIEKIKDISIGKDYANNFWDGTIDEVAIYNRVLTPKEIKQHYNNGLEGEGYCKEIVAQPKIEREIDKVIGHIEQSLDADLWIDENHLDPQHGYKVFDEEKKAVKKLMGFIDNDDTTQNIKDVCQLTINKLVTSDKFLAETALEEALNKDIQNPDNQEKYDTEIEKAVEELLKAEENVVVGNFDKAIDHYKKAWEYAQVTIKMELS